MSDTEKRLLFMTKKQLARMIDAMGDLLLETLGAQETFHRLYEYGLSERELEAIGIITKEE